MNIIAHYLKFNNEKNFSPKNSSTNSLGNFSYSKILNNDTISFKRQWRNKESGADKFSNVDIILNNYFDTKKSLLDRFSTYNDNDFSELSTSKKEEYERWFRIKPFFNELTPKSLNENIQKNFYSLIHIGLGLQVSSTAKYIKWLGFQDADYQNESCKGVNNARTVRLEKYLNLVFSGMCDDKNYSPQANEFLTKLQQNYSYKILVLLLAFHDISTSNRKIPLILDIEALAKTFETIETNRRDYSIKDVAKLYHSNIITHALNTNKNLIVSPQIDNLDDIKNLKECWVKIDGRKKDDEKKTQLVRLVEIFSNKNWCTHSSEDKAKDQVRTGDFYVCIKKDKDGNWSPITAISTCKTTKHKSKVIELQGIQNNYILSTDDYNRIKSFLTEFRSQLFIGYSIINKGTPSAIEQIRCSQYLNSSKTNSLKDAILNLLKIKNKKDDNLKYEKELQLLKELGCKPKEVGIGDFNNHITLALEGMDNSKPFQYNIKSNITNSENVIINTIPLPKSIKIKPLNSTTIPINAALINQFKSYKLNINDINILYLDKYNPMVKVTKNGFVKLAHLGVDEDSLLNNVAKIGTFHMNNTSIKEFPKKLDFVDVLYCTKEQKERFKEKIEDLKLYNPKIKIIETL